MFCMTFARPLISLAPTITVVRGHTNYYEKGPILKEFTENLKTSVEERAYCSLLLSLLNAQCFNIFAPLFWAIAIYTLIKNGCKHIVNQSPVQKLCPEVRMVMIKARIVVELYYDFLFLVGKCAI